MMLEFILLGFLKFKEMSGYQMKQLMAESTSNFFDASFGSIYPTLNKLEKQGFIAMRAVVEGGKYKKIYSITESGDEKFMHWLHEPIGFSKLDSNHLVKVFFFSFLPRKKALENLLRLKEEVKTVLNGLEKDEEQKCAGVDGFTLSTLSFGIGYYSFVIAWCDDLIKKINGGRL